MRKPKLRELKEALKAVFKGPYTNTDFPAKEAPAIAQFRGAPEFHEEDCLGCTACAQVCPANAIHVQDDLKADPPLRSFTLYYDECIFCGQCELYCPTKKGVVQSNKYDLATFDRKAVTSTVEKELVLCEVCGQVVGALDHLKWIADKLEAKKYTNPALIMVSEPEFYIARHESKRTDVPPGRADVMRILCPECRREMVLRELWG